MRAYVLNVAGVVRRPHATGVADSRLEQDGKEAEGPHGKLKITSLDHPGVFADSRRRRALPFKRLPSRHLSLLPALP